MFTGNFPKELPHKFSSHFKLCSCCLYGKLKCLPSLLVTLEIGPNILVFYTDHSRLIWFEFVCLFDIQSKFLEVPV